MLVQDDSCHWYVIPVSRQMAFCVWVESFLDGEGAPQPEWAERIGGAPSLVTFSEYEIYGKRTR
jgi:hypothetical protein